MWEEQRRSWAWKTETLQLFISSARLNRVVCEEHWVVAQFCLKQRFQSCVAGCTGTSSSPGGEHGDGLVRSHLCRSWSPFFHMWEIWLPFGERVPWWSGQAAPGNDQLKKVSAMQSVCFFPCHYGKTNSYCSCILPGRAFPTWEIYNYTYTTYFFTSQKKARWEIMWGEYRTPRSSGTE